LLVETAVLFALGMVPALYIFCAWGDHLPPLCCVTVSYRYRYNKSYLVIFILNIFQWRWDKVSECKPYVHISDCYFKDSSK
jgi:hypothetical protein